jgi:ArsR family transcriptional regulator
MANLTPELIEIVAARFKTLGEPARLHILNALRRGKLTVSQVMAETGLSQPNASKHLQLLYSVGFVARSKEGQNVYYALANRDVFKLCDIVCGRLERDADAHRKVVSSK